MDESASNVLFYAIPYMPRARGFLSDKEDRGGRMRNKQIFMSLWYVHSLSWAPSSAAAKRAETGLFEVALLGAKALRVMEEAKGEG